MTAVLLLLVSQPIMIMMMLQIHSSSAFLPSRWIVRASSSAGKTVGSTRRRAATSLYHSSSSAATVSGTNRTDHNSIASCTSTAASVRNNSSTNVNVNVSTSNNSKKSEKGIQQAPELPSPDTFPASAFEPRPFFRYELLHQSTKPGSQARVGRIHTPHGIIDTPGFVAVATNGALKGLTFADADASNQQLVFCNSYHLLLQPGPEVIAGAGGLHKFVRRTDRPFITDSGGFQVFSLAYGSVHEELSSKGELKKSHRNRKNDSNANKNNSPVKVSEEGVLFQSYRDGRKIMLTPESTVQAQKAYGADIIIPLDELPPYHIDRQRLVDSVALSHRWEARSLKEHLKDVKEQAMYCVVHGGLDVELRTQSVEYLTSLPFDGYAIGGSLGSNRTELMDLLDWMMPMFDEGHRRDKPRHLLGIADEEGIRGAVARGLDTMDSCYPTRVSRHGTFLTRQGKLHIKSSKHSRSYGIPIDDQCSCSTCRNYDRAYLWHLFKAKEPLFIQLAAQHNIHFMNDLMAQLRQDIMENKI